MTRSYRLFDLLRLARLAFRLILGQIPIQALSYTHDLAHGNSGNYTLAP